MEVSISTATAEALIYYTTDNSVPTVDSLLYSAPFMLYDDTLVQAIAVREGYSDSLITSTSLTVGNIAPSISAIANQIVTEGETISFTVQATDPDSGLPELSATGLPSGATFVDHADGTATFSWITQNSDIGTHELTLIATDALNEALTDSITITLTVNSAVAQTAAFIESGGLVVMEAEHYSSRFASYDNYFWEIFSEVQASGGNAITASTDASDEFANGYTIESSRVDYNINFTQTGTYSLWIQGDSQNGLNDTVYVGLNGVPKSSGLYFRIPYDDNYTWISTTQSGGKFTINITEVGVNTLNLWMRETGFIVDRILLTNDGSYSPIGTDPAESNYE